MAHATNYRGPATHTGKSSSGGDRSRLLSYLAQQLMRVAHQHHVAMVVTNHVTTRLSRRDVSSNNTTTTNSTLAPALGGGVGSRRDVAGGTLLGGSRALGVSVQESVPTPGGCALLRDPGGGAGARAPGEEET